jgi:hypothetical protein
MGVLRSDLFKDDAKLEACAAGPSGHLTLGVPPGPHIGKLHAALALLDPAGPAISAAEKSSMTYGPTTAEAVFHYKSTHVPPIINLGYQKTPDKIVGQQTILAMDEDLAGKPVPRSEVVDRAFNDSRGALRAALSHLRGLRDDINKLPGSSDPAFSGAMVTLLNRHKRNIQVLSRRLLLTPDPATKAFRDALDKVIRLVESNLANPNTLFAAGLTGLCDPHNPRNAGGLPWAWTLSTQPDPKSHLCEPFFTRASRELQRDVVTHEYFHLFGLADISVANTDQALRNANTIAQIVAYLADRFRQENSDHNPLERAVPPFPAP